jgi:hypothetical protein
MQTSVKFKLNGKTTFSTRRGRKGNIASMIIAEKFPQINFHYSHESIFRYIKLALSLLRVDFTKRREALIKLNVTQKIEIELCRYQQL